MIPVTDINTLISASDLLAVSNTAVAEQAQMAMARALNGAANTGETWIDWNQPLSDGLKTTLETMGYVITPRYIKESLVPNFWRISWK